MRDDFLVAVKETLAKRVANRCSNQGCRKTTSGPRTDPDKAVNIGVAAHITAAAPGGPRYDPSLTPEQRASIENGIWLCQSCSKLIDADEQRYPTARLRKWKQDAEAITLQELEQPSHDQVHPRNSSETTIQPPRLSELKARPTHGIIAVSATGPARVYSIYAASSSGKLSLDFDITNSNLLELRIVDISLEVLSYQPIYALRVQPYAGVGKTLHYSCNINPSLGSYRCRANRQDFDYVKLSHGELEHFEVDAATSQGGLYYIRATVQYSCGGNTASVSSPVISVAFYRTALESGTSWRPGASALGAFTRDEAARVLLTVLADGDDVSRQRAAIELGYMSNVAAIPGLIRLLTYDNERVSGEAAQLLGQLRAKDAIPHLERYIVRDDSSYIAGAIEALGMMGPAAVPALETIYAKGTRYMREHVMYASENIGSEAMSLLQTAMTDAEADVRGHVPIALARCGGKNAVPYIAAMLNDEDNHVSESAAWQLCQLGGEDAKRALIDARRSGRSTLVDKLPGMVTHPLANFTVGDIEEMIGIKVEKKDSDVRRSAVGLRNILGKAEEGDGRAGGQVRNDVSEAPASRAIKCVLCNTALERDAQNRLPKRCPRCGGSCFVGP